MKSVWADWNSYHQDQTITASWDNGDPAPEVGELVMCRDYTSEFQRKGYILQIFNGHTFLSGGVCSVFLVGALRFWDDPGYLTFQDPLGRWIPAKDPYAGSVK